MRSTQFIRHTVAATVVTVAAGLTLSCSSDSEPTTDACPPPPSANTATADGWLGYLAQHGDDTGLVLDTGTGTTVEHRENDRQPLASAVKVVHLAAYARAVAGGALDPNERVQVTDWERWYFPGTDGGAHPKALARLGGPSDVTLDQLVGAMIQESDNAAADYLLDRLGDRALIDAANAGGWQNFTPATKLGSMLRARDSSITVGTERDAARRYANDPAYRAEMTAKPPPGYEQQAAWADTTEAGSAADLASIHRSIATGSFGPGADVARRHLEWQPPTPGSVAVGFKGGSLAGVLTDAIYVRRDDGTVATAVLLNRRMPKDPWVAAVTALPEQALLIDAMQKKETAQRLQCAV